MIKNSVVVLCLFFLTSQNLFSQQFVLSGKVRDDLTNKTLSFANIRIDETTNGTAANIEGEFELKLERGNYKIIISYIGYHSDTLDLNLIDNMREYIFLEPTQVRLSEITVLPGLNPAIEVLEKIIRAKQIRNGKLNSYKFKAYTKGLIKTTKDISTGDNSIGLSLGGADSSKLKISGIIENESIGYFEKPDNYKDEIIARKQSANTPPTINILTGSRLLKNFYEDDLEFFGKELLSPIADDALEFYYYYIEDSLKQDDNTILKINFSPIDEYDPGFIGRIYIKDKSFDLVKVEAELNTPANPGNIFSQVLILQQFLEYDDNIYMPIDYRMFVEGNYLGIFKFGFELNAIFHNYEINPTFNEDLFDMTIIKVRSDADNKDVAYWNSIQTIPNTLDEVNAYNRIDSVEMAPKTFSEKFSLLSPTLELNENLSITGPLGLYSFNRVEGNALNFSFYFNNLNNRRFYLDTDLKYGFSDKRFKYDIAGDYFLGEYRTEKVSLNIFNKLTPFFYGEDHYNVLTSTLVNLIKKHDFRNYHYTSGYELMFESQLFPILKLGGGIGRKKDVTAEINTDFSIFSRNKEFNANPAITNATINYIKASFGLDFRNFIEDGYRRRRITGRNAFVLIDGDVLYSKNNLIKSDYNFTQYNAKLFFRTRTFNSSSLQILAGATYTDGLVPYQMMGALPGNINAASKSNTFRTIKLGEVFGDKLIRVHLENNFNDEIFRLLGLRFLKSLELQLSVHASAAWSEVSEKNKLLNNTEFIEFKNPFYEAGFSVGHVLIPMRFSFTWKLNHRDKNNFAFGINSFIF